MQFDPNKPLHTQEIATLHLDQNGLDALEALHEHSPIMAVHTGNVMEGVMQCFDPDLEEIRANLLHDLGKLGTSKDILEKEAPLSDIEFRRIRFHPINGLRYTRRFGIELSEKETLIVALHHVRYEKDGSQSLRLNSYPKLKFDKEKEVFFYRGIELTEELLKAISELAFFDTLDAVSAKSRKEFAGYVGIEKAPELMERLIEMQTFSPIPEHSQELALKLPLALDVKREQLERSAQKELAIGE
jgi:hypothetical protein